MAHKLLQISLFVLVISSLAAGIAGRRYKAPAGASVVHYLPDLKTFDLPGMTHITIAGAVRDGMKEVEVFIETTAPGKGTPIHRHECEEVVTVVSGHGTVYVAPAVAKGPTPVAPIAYPFGPNSTFTVPFNVRHQIWNTGQEDVFYFAVASRPPLIVYTYESFEEPYKAGVKVKPALWDVDP